MLHLLCHLAFTSMCFEAALPPSRESWSTLGWQPKMISYQDSVKMYGYVRWRNSSDVTAAVAERRHDQLGALRVRDLVRGREIAVPALKDSTPPRGFATGMLLQHLKLAHNVQEQLKILGVASSSKLFEAMSTAVDGYCSPSTQVAADKLRRCFVDKVELLHFFNRTVLQLNHPSTSAAARSYEIVEPAGFPAHVIPHFKIQSVERLHGNIILMCHTVAFPVTLLSCHNIPGTLAFAVDGIHSTNASSSAIVVCHTDTATFDPRSVPFLALGITPGEDVCHFLAENDILVLDG